MTLSGCCTLWKHSSGRSSCRQMQEMGEETERMFCYWPFVSSYNTRARVCVHTGVCFKCTILDMSHSDFVCLFFHKRDRAQP